MPVGGVSVDTPRGQIQDSNSEDDVHQQAFYVVVVDQES